MEICGYMVLCLSVCQSVCLSFINVSIWPYVCVCVCLSVSLCPFINLSIWPYVCASVCLSTCISVSFYQSVCLTYVCMSVCLSVNLSFYHFISLSIWPYVCVSVCLSVLLSIYLTTCMYRWICLLCAVVVNYGQGSHLASDTRRDCSILHKQRSRSSYQGDRGQLSNLDIKYWHTPFIDWLWSDWL